MSYIFSALGITLAIILLYRRSGLFNAYKTNREYIQNQIKQNSDEGTVFISHNAHCGCVLDRNKEEIVIYKSGYQDYKRQYEYTRVSIPFKDIIKAETVIDNSTVTTISRGSQLGGAVIGGALAGGVGALIGGTTGSRSSTSQIKEAKIKLTVNNLDDPIQTITFLNGEDKEYMAEREGYDKRDLDFINGIRELEKWQGMFDIILKQ